MSGKHAREVRRLKALLMEAHSQLHAGNVDEAHEALHRAMEAGKPSQLGKRLATQGDLDGDIAALSDKHGCHLLYVSMRLMGDNSVSIAKGGSAFLSAAMDPHVPGFLETLKTLKPPGER